MMEIRFTYTNSQGETRERTIAATAANKTHLEGMDAERHAVRTFCLDRIHNGEVTVLQTGEVLAVVDVCVRLPLLVFQDKVKPPQNAQIHFTGFPAKRKEELAVLAQNAGLQAVKSLTAHLTYLVYNSQRAAPSAGKIDKARQAGATVWTEAEFAEWLKNS